MATNPINQTLAIMFANVPSDYTVNDIILKHLNYVPNKTEITNKQHQRWLRAIRLIEFTSNNKCVIVFSSIFYWAKISRLVLKREKKLKVSVHPKYYTTIEHAQNIDLICSNIRLYNISSSTVSYTFITNNSLWITTKLPSEQELLIKIPSANISNAQIIEHNNKPNDIKHKKEECKYDSELILSLNKNCI
eukprot:158601_1